MLGDHGVMANNELAVFSAVYVHFDIGREMFVRRLESFERVLRGVSRRTAVSDRVKLLRIGPMRRQRRLRRRMRLRRRQYDNPA